jgi:hypothetical protein
VRAGNFYIARRYKGNITCGHCDRFWIKRSSRHPHLLDWQVLRLFCCVWWSRTTSIGTSPVLLNAVVIELVSMRCHYAKFMSEFTKDRAVPTHPVEPTAKENKTKQNIHWDLPGASCSQINKIRQASIKIAAKVADATCFQRLQGCGGRHIGHFST